MTDAFEKYPDEVLADLRGIEADRNFPVQKGHAIMSEGLAFWRQTGDIGWHLSDKGRAALAATKGGA